MSASWTDDELLRICAGTSLANIDPDQWAAFQQRWLKAESFQQAVENSPIRNELLARLSDSGSHTATELPIASTARSRSGRFARLAVLLVGIAVTAFFAVRESQLRPDGFDVAQQGDDAEITIGSTQADHPSKSAQADDVTNPTAGSEQGANAETTPVTTTTPSVTTTPVAAAAGEDGVWNGPLDLQKPPLNLQDTVWQPTAAIAPDGMTPAVFAKWFQAVANRPFKLSEDKVDKRVFTNFEGHTRLRAPWVDAAVLRLALYSVDKCDITFWRANAGIRFTLVKSPTPVIWAAYRVTRADSKSDAVLGELLGTDNARWEISRFGIFECRVEHSHVMLARGHIPLVRVPFEGLPDEVHFEGKFRIRDLRMYRGDPLPVHEFDAYRGPQGINQLATTNPAELDWTVNVDDAVTFEKVIANGTTQAAAVELRTNASLKETAFAVLPVPKAGLSEIVFRVEHADAGTGLCIGAASGPPYSKVGFQLEPKSKRVVAMAPMPWLQVSEVSKDTSSVPIAYLGPTQWFRLIGSAASVQVWISHDGRDWSWLGQHQFPNEWRRVEAVRLFALPGAARRIRVSHLEVREFPIIAALANAELCQRVDVRAFEPLMSIDYGTWLHHMIRTRPQEVSLSDWRRACAIESLRVGASPLLSAALLGGLTQEDLFGDESLDAARQRVTSDVELERGLLHDLHLLSELALLHQLVDYNNSAAFAQLWHAVTEKWIAISETMPVQQRAARRRVISDRCLEAMLTQPLRCASHLKLLSIEGTRRELSSLVAAGRFVDALEWIDRLTFFMTDAHPLQFWWSPAESLYYPVLWAELNAQQGLDGDAQLRRLTLPRRWKSTPPLIQHALAQPLSKEAYNVMAEFNAAISGQAYDDACQIIGAAANGQMLGILPDSRESQLLVSFPRAVALAMEEHPELLAAMNEKYGAIGRLRVRQAMENGDVPVLEAATVQFYGTLAAAESERWLGDRAFAAGEFDQAHAHYASAKDGFERHSQVQTIEMSELAARQQLVAAMLGLNEPASLNTSIAFGDQSLTKAQLDELSREMLLDSGAVRAGDVANQRTQSLAKSVMSSRVPAVQGYRLESRAKFRGDLGERVGGAATADIDWCSRQLAVAVDESRVVVSNRFQVSCFDLESGDQQWSTGLRGEQGVAHHWPMVSMQPLMFGSSVICRRLTKTGPELHCLDRESGKLKWRAGSNASIVSDAWLARGRLQVFAADVSPAGPVELRLLTLHAETGSLLSDTSVVRLFDDALKTGHPCQFAVRDGFVYFIVSGVVGCCDLQGQVVWLRRQLWQPPLMDGGRHQRAYDSPLFHGDLMLVSQPGVPVIEALEANSGRVRWSRASGDHRRLLGITGGRLLIETNAGVEALDADSGAVLWHYAAADLLDAVVVPTSDGPSVGVSSITSNSVVEPSRPAESDSSGRQLLVSRWMDSADYRKVPTLVWIDIERGHEVGYQLLDNLIDKEPRLGPLLVAGQKQWLFVGKGRLDGERQIFEMIPNPETKVVQGVDQRLWAQWLPEFQRGTFSNSVIARPSFNRRLQMPSLRDAYAKQFPGWVVMAPLIQPRDSGSRAEFRGQKEVVAIQLALSAASVKQNLESPEVPVEAARLIQQITIPKGARASEAMLKIRVGHEAKRSWEIIVDAGSKRLHRSKIDDESAPDGWRDLQIDLSSHAGETVDIVVTCMPLATGAIWIYWKDLKFEFAGNVN